jgi:hypothetical protein
MTWMGPLPDEVDPVADSIWTGTMTLAGPWPAEAQEGGAVTSALEPIVWAGPFPPMDEPEGFVLRDERRRFTAGSR